jgi:SAM-dependent methyltransferase
MRALLKRIYRSTVTLNHEARKVAEFVGRACTGPSQKCRVLEVGCGYGRYLRVLSGLGFDVTGVDANPELVRANREAGLRCFTAEEFRQSTDSYDVMLMSHVIEHFAPQDLVPFMDSYLDRLKGGGKLVIATPLLTRFFYDDFDHVKPYHPVGLLMVFGEEQAQVQYYARNKLRLEDVWIRRGHWRFAHRRARYVRSPVTRLLQLVEFGSAVAFRLSLGIVGQADGWVGVFRKVGTPPAVG